jgi:DNA-3-methyladenine glycosylase
MHYQPLPPSFFTRASLDLARNLLGQILVKVTDEGTTSGIIVETEAYLGLEDRAAHSYGNRRTKRTEIMYHPPGHAYVYQMHTHHLINIVSGAEGDPQAVLIRAVEPLSGIHLMEKRRPVIKRTNLTSGPGKLTKAFGITKDDYGRTLFAPPLFIAKGIPVTEIAIGKRIGIDNTGEAKDYPYRFWVPGNPYVSR